MPPSPVNAFRRAAPALGKRLAAYLTAALFTALLHASASAQVPITYYDFENNATRTTFENAVEQSINGGSGAVTRVGNTGTAAGVSGAGTFNGGSASGQAITSSDWSNATADPGAGATTYYQFVVNTNGFSQISISFDNQASATGPARVGVLYSTNGTTFTAASTTLTGNAAFVKSSFDLSGINAIDNTTVTIRLYAFAGSAADRTGRSAFGSGGTFRIDNLQVLAASTTSAAGTKTLLNEPSIYTSTTSGLTGSVFNRSGFTITGNTVVNVAAQQGLTGSGFTVSNDAILQINTGGFFSGQGPTFNEPSFLSYNTGGTYGRGLEWSATSGPGYPNKVAINNNTTLEMGANGGAATARQMSGRLSINSGNFQMAGANPMTAPVTVLGDVVISTGALTLSTSSGGDLKVGGLWSRNSAATFTPNGRAVFFVGAGAQTVTISGGGVETFAYLVVDKPGGNLTLGTSTSVIVTGPGGGSALQILNAGGIDLGGNGLTLNGTVAGTNILVGGTAAPATRTVTGTGSFAVTNGPKSVTSNNGKTLTFDTGVNVSLSQGVDFGAGLTAINGALTLVSGGFVNTNPPTYGGSSTLVYDCTCVYGRGLEWSATSGPGYPNDVQANFGTAVNVGSTTPSVARQIAGSLDAKNGGSFLMNHPSSPMTAALIVSKNVIVEAGGSLNLSTALGGDLRLQGNFTNDGNFNANNRAVFFDGGATQLVNAASGSLVMPYVRVNKGGGTVQLGNTDLTTLGPNGGDSLQFTGAASTLTLNGRALTLGSTVGPTAAGSGFVGDAAADLSLQDGGTAGALGTLVFVAGGRSLENLTINRTGGAGSAALGSDLTLAGTLALNAGDILTGAFTLTHHGGSTGTTDVVGNVRRTDLGGTPRQFGNPNNQISFQTGTAPTEMTVNLVKSRPTGAGFGFPNAVERTYTITPNGGDGFTSTLRLHYNDPELNGNTEALLDFWRFDGTNWNRVPKTLADPVADNWIESSLVTQYSPWTLSSRPLAPTQARLREFRATLYREGTLVEWQTQYEVDNLGFNVYREDGGRRTLVTPSLIAGSALTAGPRTVLGAGGTYTWVDRGGTPSARYWLEDVDTDGQSTMHGPFSPAPQAPGRPMPEGHQSLLLSQLGSDTAQTGQHQWLSSDRASNTTSNGTSNNVAGGSAPGDIGSLPEENDERQRRLAAGAAVKLSVRRAGWYRVTRAQLEAAGLGHAADPARLQLFAEGVEQSIRVNEAEWQISGAVEFYGEGLDTPATDTRVYWLVEGATAGRRMGASPPAPPAPVIITPPFIRRGVPPPAVGFDVETGAAEVDAAPLMSADGAVAEADGAAAQVQSASSASDLDISTDGGDSPTSFVYTAELRERNIYFSSLLNGEEENFFGRVVGGTEGAQALAVRDFENLDGNAGRLEVALQGVTAGAHRVRVRLNGAEVGTVEFAGREHKTASYNVEPWMLREGDNQVALVSGGAGDVSLTDYLRLSYRRTFRAEDDALRFPVSGGGPVRVTGFTSADVRVYDVTDPNDAAELTASVEPALDTEGVGFAAVVQVAGASAEAPRTLLALTGARVAQVEGARANQPSDWHAGQEADFVVVTHGSFRDAVAPLAARRAEEGLATKVVDVEDLYDEFSFGAHAPQAVKDFLAWTAQHWQRAPRYVLLVGDGSYDPRNRTGRGSFDLVPAKLIDTEHMETASDNWLADFDGDGLAEMSVGRLPLRTADEAALVLGKIVNFAPGGTQNAALLVADRAGSDGFSFEAATDGIQSLLPATVAVNRINRGAQGADAVRGQIVGGINAGPRIVNWMGHGSISVWTGDGLLRSQDAGALTNANQLPLFVMMTCLNGYYQDPSVDSLSESLLKAASGGAVAVWTSTGMTEPDGQAEMNRELYRALFAGPEPLRLGDAMRRARAATTDRDVRRTWVLIGDPTTRWQ